MLCLIIVNVDSPKSAKTAKRAVNDIGKANCPYPSAPKNLAIKIIRKNLKPLFTNSAKNNQKLFFIMVWNVPWLLNKYFFPKLITLRTNLIIPKIN